MIEVRNLSKKYGEKQVLKDVNLSVGEGEIVGLFGENGAGKTTLFQCILGFLRYQGTVLLDGKEISRKNIGRISFATCEHSFFLNLTPEAHAGFYQGQFPDFRKTRFQGLMDFFELPMKKPLKTFSVGQQNQFEVILALSQGADYILMDEPFSGNDILNREDFYKVLLGILEPEETIVLSTHLVEEVEQFIGRAVILQGGSVVQDVCMMDLEEKGQTLVGLLKETYRYQSDRVSRALDTFGQGVR